MEEKTLFKLARAITDTGTDTVSSKGGTVTYRITSIKRYQSKNIIYYGK